VLREVIESSRHRFWLPAHATLGVGGFFSPGFDSP
jgi:hypothetical protein